MTHEPIEFLSAVLIVSKDPERLARFYRDVLGVPLEAEDHEGALPHWGCTLGDVHFAIHPIEDFPDHRSGVGAVRLAFTVFDIHGAARRLQERGAALLHPPRDTGYFWTTAVEDPDGNLVELTELCDEWFETLQRRHAEGIDVVRRWRGRRA
jgi:predicted enzyme related to lactoylglutathione lyase